MTPRDRFIERLPLADAWAWLVECPDTGDSEPAPLDQAFDRVLCLPLIFAADRPDRDLVLTDGYAVRAENTLGASSYNPLWLRPGPQGYRPAGRVCLRLPYRRDSAARRRCGAAPGGG